MPYAKSSNASTESFTKSLPPHKDRLDKVTHELRFKNEDAFREVLRLPPLKGHARVKLAHARKFWTGLEHMSQYWDTTLDEYYEVPDTDTKAEAAPTIPGTDIRAPPSAATNADTDTTMLDAGERQKMKRVYKGRRIGTGKDMPEEYRDETLRGLVEAVAWAFNCQVAVPNQQPRVLLGKILVPVKQTLVVGRSPKDRVEARKGMLEGPMMGVFSRGHAGYGPDAQKDAEQGALCDLLREVGSMVELAQQRGREEQFEVRGKESDWWSRKPRWGGGTGGPMGWEDELQKQVKRGCGEPKERKKRPLSEAEMDKILEELDEADLVPSHIRSKPERREKDRDKEGAVSNGIGNGRGRGGSGGRGGRWNAVAERWKTVKPGPSLWDARMKYMRIGQVKPDSEDPLFQGGNTHFFDDIFMVSSINHHVSVLRLRVSDEYLAWLADEQSQEKASSSGSSSSMQERDPEVNTLQIWRTEWYDLFDAEKRVELTNGLWRIMSWLMRDDENPK